MMKPVSYQYRLLARPAMDEWLAFPGELLWLAWSSSTCRRLLVSWWWPVLYWVGYEVFVHHSLNICEFSKETLVHAISGALVNMNSIYESSNIPLSANKSFDSEYIIMILSFLREV